LKPLAEQEQPADYSDRSSALRQHSDEPSGRAAQRASEAEEADRIKQSHAPEQDEVMRLQAPAISRQRLLTISPCNDAE
jgi:hypothetical protein